MNAFYAVVGMGMMVAAIFWIASPRSRARIRRLALIAGLIALALAIAYNYSQRDEAGAASYGWSDPWAG
ncbi:hypothetical protein LX16_0436 [Stackebrandtia albiflava]|uniref:Uncharacterized protein n=1 Tax=Stackebrandtia albiflava TaxID=406432 RepID=A0A562VAB4_9ACTN|nr:hypothetical protein [Stackebrandtia albiflava]TWJ14747.1 hypothetical protein LX16_0436 [Stackebrandtia albiflava]